MPPVSSNSLQITYAKSSSFCTFSAHGRLQREPFPLPGPSRACLYDTARTSCPLATTDTRTPRRSSRLWTATAGSLCIKTQSQPLRRGWSFSGALPVHLLRRDTAFLLFPSLSRETQPRPASWRRGQAGGPRTSSYLRGAQSAKGRTCIPALHRSPHAGGPDEQLL